MKDNFESAVQFALKAHRGQLDKGWTPYIQHLMGVWSQVRNQSLTTQIVALLHDTIEDTDTVYSELETEFGEDVAKAIQVLTHERGMKYELYIDVIIASKNRHAILVKIADLTDNSSTTRLQRLPETSRAYFEKRAAEKYGPARSKLLKALEELDASSKS